MPAKPSTPGAGALSERRFGVLIIGLLAAGFVVVAGMVFAAGLLLLRAQAYGAAVEHSYDVEAELADFRIFAERAEGSRRGYLLTGAPRYQTTFAQAAARLKPLLADLRRATADNPAQQRRLDQLDRLMTEKLGLMEQMMAARRTQSLEALLPTFLDPRQQSLTDQIRVLSADMFMEERRLLAQRTERQNANARILLVVVMLAGLLLAIVALASTLIMRRYARNLVRSQAALRQLNESLEDRVRERTADLTRANQEIQRFAYIVSHDLRAPLVNIMGFTSELEAASKPLSKLIEEADARAPELVGQEARQAVELDLPESIGFIRSSTQKMDRLISAILKLSREGRRTLNPEAIVMDALLAGVVQSLRRQADDRGAEVGVEGSLPDLVSDRVALEQVFSNLVENALKYLKPGRPGRIVVRGRREAGRVVYEVEDNGRGVDPRDHERIFELFRRAGAQDQPGEGIGLAHVRALVYRLGGTIDCVSALDQGATFRISLPAALKREETQAP